MKIFDMYSDSDKRLALTEIKKLDTSHEAELAKLLSWQITYCKEIASNKNGYDDKVMVYGASEKFDERKLNPSPVALSEIYDISNDVKKIKQQDYEVVGGLGGFSFNNGRYAGELIFLPGGSCMRVHLDHGLHTAMMVDPMNIYPLCVFTARRATEGKGNRMFIVVFENGERIAGAMEKISAQIKSSKETITSVISGSFSNLSGYIFSGASPQTLLHNLDMKESKNLLLYQTLLCENIRGFKRALHTHGFEAARFGEPHAFGAHFDNATVDVALGVFSVAGEVEKH